MGQHIHEYFMGTITLLKGLRSQLHCICLEQRCHLNMAAVDSLSLSLSQASKQTFANANCLTKIKMSYWNFAKYRSSILHARVQHPREKANIQGTCIPACLGQEKVVKTLTFTNPILSSSPSAWSCLFPGPFHRISLFGNIWCLEGQMEQLWSSTCRYKG